MDLLLQFYFYKGNFNLNPASNLQSYQNKGLSDSANKPDPANFSSLFKKNINVLAGSWFNE
jgi:hypothetical protein